MLIIPAVDLMEGKCVRLIQGDPNKRKIYYDDPLEAAELFLEQGAKMIHLVDLDAAMMRGENTEVIERIIKKVPLKIQVAGGFRGLDKIESILKMGACRVVLGTVCIKNPEIVVEATKKFGSQKIIAAIDLLGGVPAFHGWKEKSTMNYIDLARSLERTNIGGIIVTCVDVDGTLSGPSLDEVSKLKKIVNIPIIASGGIKELEDIRRLSQTHVDGIIIGKALYEEKFDLVDALRVAENAF
jgi:phosphoribosylformimino-5-aminoimidazole carboxamide ribotide isomerase